MDENKFHVLYIEDDPVMIELVSIILSRHNMKIISADGGRQGLDLLRQQKPELILLDLMMPDMDGWDVYHQIKSSESTKNIPVIVITAKAQAIDRVLGLNIAKVDDYICKPFRPQELLESIEKVLKRN